MQLATWFKSMGGKLAVSLRRFPLALMLAAAATFILITLNHGEFLTQTAKDTLGRLAMAFGLGIPVSLCLKIYFESRPSLSKGTQGLLWGLAALSLGLYYHFLLPDFNLVPVTRYLGVTLGLYCLFTFIPYRDQRPGYEQYIVGLLRQFFITVLYGIVLFIGLAATVFAMDQLLFPLPPSIYLDLWYCVVGLFGPAFFLAEIPAPGEELATVDYSKLLKVLLYYIVMPLILAYTVILYLYFAKILFTRQWPVGMVSHLVLWYAMVTTFVLVILYPQREQSLWVKNFSSAMPMLLLPLLAMMFVAMGIRIRAYGITENRYFVLAAGIWVSISLIYLLFTKKPKNVFLTLLLVVMTFFTVFGPGSAYSLSKASQAARFEELLRENNMLQKGQIVKAPASLSKADKKSLSSIIYYFDRYHGLEQLPYLPPDFKIGDMKDTFGFSLDIYGGKEQFFAYYLEGELFLPIQDYDYFYSFHFPKEEKASYEGPLTITYDPQSHLLQVSSQGQLLYEKDLDQIGLTLHAKNQGQGEVSQGELSFTEEKENLRLHYVFKHLSGWEDQDTGEVTIDFLEFYIFIKVK